MIENAEPPVVKKRRLTAALLNVAGGWVGYLYAGHPGRALASIAFSAVALAAVAQRLWGLVDSPWAFIGLAVVYLLAWSLFILDAARLAGRTPGRPDRWYNNWWIYSFAMIASIGFNVALTPIVTTLGGVKSFSIPSGAMAPTLTYGDYVIADLNAYRITPPARGDVAVFLLPSDNATTFVKRVVGLPGDEVEMRHGVLVINGREVPKGRIGDYMHREADAKTLQAPQYVEKLPEGATYRVLDTIDEGPGDNKGPFRVPAEHYFVIGDNRDNSTDSRFVQVGFVPRQNFIGKMRFIFWARELSRIGSHID